MLQDEFGRQFRYLRLSITDVCNFRCSYCLPDGYQCETPRDFLNLQEIKTTLKAFAQMGTNKVRITGGEPALRKDLPLIIEAARNTAGIEQVAITTNGFNLPKQISRWVDAGLTSLNVSIDSLDSRVFTSITGHDKLNTILEGIDLARQLGIPVKVNTVLTKQLNQAAIERFKHWLLDTSVTLRFIELMQTGNNTVFFGDNHIQGETIKAQLLAEGWCQVVRDKAAGPAQEFQHANYQGKIGLIMPYSKDFCRSCNRLRISSIGKLHLCLFAEQGIDLRPLMASGNVNGMREALQSAIKGKDVSHWLQDGVTGATEHFAMLGG